MPTNQPTRVRAMRVKSGISETPPHPAKEAAKTETIKIKTPLIGQSSPDQGLQSSSAVLTTYPKRPTLGVRMLALDKLLRNVAVVGALLLIIVAIRNTGGTGVQSVFSAIQTGTNMEWDESLGKLSFVSNLLPSSVQEVWSQQDSISVLAPVNGDVVHAWSREEPYLELKSSVSDVRAVAGGEIMSIAHGLDEEYIVRLRHDDNTESIYGNLAACYMDEGDYVFAGDIIATVLDGKPLAFELRKDGRSIDPEGKLQSLQD